MGRGCSIAPAPRGYLFTDIEGSTQRWESAPSLMDAAVLRHNAIIEALVKKHKGEIQDWAGDGVFVFFVGANPLACALDIQAALQQQDWSAVGGLQVRIGVHADPNESATGEADRRAINRAARITASASGGQIVVSAAAAKAYPAPEPAILQDLGMHHLRGLAEPLRLFELRHALLQKKSFPPLNSHIRMSAGVPAVKGPLIGRERDVKEAWRQLEASRLVTIVGPGGNGKTRLAVEIAQRQEVLTPVYFVSLTNAVGEGALESAIARDLQFPLHAGAALPAQLIAYFRDKNALLVLDNAEGISGVAYLVRDLLYAAPALRVLSTSRQPLEIEGETLFALGGLALPSLEDPGAAGALFQAAAAEAGANIVLEGEDRRVFAALCAAVWGSPLALRLMAQWARVLTLQDMLNRLEAGSDLLADRDRDERHGSWKGVFEASWGLLQDDEQKALSALSIFAAPMDWKAAQAVGGVALETFARLASKGLLEASDALRFGMHPLVRTYARQRLSLDPDWERDCLNRHAHYFLGGLSQKSGQALDERPLASQAAAPDICLAWTRALECNDGTLISEAVEPLCYYLHQHSMLREGVAAFAPEGARDSSWMRYFSAIQANFLVQSGRPDEACKAAAEAAQDEHAPALARAHAKMALAGIAHMRGETETAAGLYQAVLSIRDGARDCVGCAYAGLSLAALQLAASQVSQAKNAIKVGFKFAREAENAPSVIVAHLLSGDVAALEGRLDAARTNFETGLDVARRSRNTQYRGQLLRRLGVLLGESGELERAREHLGEALEHVAGLGDERACAHIWCEIAAVDTGRGDHVAAKKSLLRSARLALRLQLKPLLAKVLVQLGRTELALGQDESAARLASVVAGTSAPDDGLEALIAALHDRGLVLAEGFDLEAAVQLAEDEVAAAALLLEDKSAP